MTLILLLLVLVTERVALQGNRWQVESYLTWYLQKFLSKLKEEETLPLLIFVAAPGVIFGLLIYLIDLGLFEFLVSLFVLGVVIGNPVVRATYRQFLNAETRGDSEAMLLLQAQLSDRVTRSDCAGGTKVSEDVTSEQAKPVEVESQSNEQNSASRATEDNKETSTTERRVYSLSESLIWCNFKYYAAPIFYFVLFGIPGVVFYTLVIYLLESDEFKSTVSTTTLVTLNKWAEWLYWLPARFVAIGFMFVGHFTHGLESYLRLAANFSVSGFDIITQVAHAAEGRPLDDDADTNDMTNKYAKNMVKLAKRNMALFIVVVALLTLYGYVV